MKATKINFLKLLPSIKQVVLVSLLLSIGLPALAKEKTVRVSEKIIVSGEFKGKTLLGPARFFIADKDGKADAAVLEGVFDGLHFTSGSFKSYGLTINDIEGDINISENGALINISLQSGFIKEASEQKDCGPIQSSQVLIYPTNTRRLEVSDIDQLLQDIIKGNNLPLDIVPRLCADVFYYVSGIITPNISISDEILNPIIEYTGSKEYTISDVSDRRYFYLGSSYGGNNNLCNSLSYERGNYSLTFSTDHIAKIQGSNVTLLNKLGEKLSYNYVTKKLLPSNIVREHYSIILDDAYAAQDPAYQLFDGYLSIKNVTYTFPNGITFEGEVSEDFLPGSSSLEGKCLVSSPSLFFDDIIWDYKDFTAKAQNGKLSFPDGSYYIGSFNSQFVPNSDDFSPELFMTGKLMAQSGSIIHEYQDGADEHMLQERQSFYAESSAKDFFKFNDYGNVYEFRKTFENGVVVEYHQDSTFIFTFPKGIVCDIAPSFNKHDFDSNGLRSYFVKETGYSTRNYLHINNVYRSYLSDASIKYDPFSLPFKEYTLNYPDGNVLFMSINSRSYEGRFHDIYHQDNCIDGFVQVMPNNERIFVRRNDCVSLSKSFDNYRVTMPSWTDVSIMYKNGDSFHGYAHPIADGVEKLSNPILADAFRKYMKEFPTVYFENITGMKIKEGKVINSKGQLIDIYQNGEKLSDFDKAQIIAKEQGEINLARQEAENQKAREKELVNKYGKKYVDAFYRGHIIVGMPQELFALGLSTRSFNGVFSASVSIVHENSTCFDLYNIGGDFKTECVGYVWINDGRVSSITLY